MLNSKIRNKIDQWWNISRHYTAEINTYRIIWVNPNEIFDRSQKLIEHEDRYQSHIIDGDWDEQEVAFEKRELYQSMRRRYLEDESWSETEHYRKTLESIEQGKPTWHGCSSKDELHDRCNFIDTLFESISENGYMTQHEMRTIPPRLPLEVKVAIGRNGHYYYVNGKHRLSIAKILELDAIPVHVIIRHPDWQAIRDEIARWDSQAELSEAARENLTHPDIVYLRT